MRISVFLPVLLLTAAVQAGVTYPLPKLPPDMKRVEGQFHLLIHDLSDLEGAEVITRMEAMVREYQKRTRDFAGRIQGKMPFILFRNENDYHAAGGMEGTAGVFNGEQLMAVAGRGLTAGTWRTIQHEGFHQFASNVIGGELPTWVNEGLAEYFGEGVYTGDGFVTGGIPAFRLKRVQESIADKQFKSIDGMMRLSHEKWNAEMKSENYDQAWAMVQFLAHADDGKYQKAFSTFMISLSRRQPWARAWDEAFGSAEGFEQRWNKWWNEQQGNCTPDVYAEAATRMLANYAARSISQKQAVSDVDALLKTIDDGTIKSAPGDVLPPGLAKDCVSLTAAVRKIGGSFALEFAAKGATTVPLAVTCTMPDGKIIRATTPTRGPRAVVPVVTTKVPKQATTRKSG